MNRFRTFAVPLCAIALFLLLGWVGGRDNPFDVWVVKSLVPVRDHFPASERIAAGLTQIGSLFGTFGLVIIGAVWLAFRRRFAHAALLLGAMLAERVSMDGIKLIYHRSRPSFDTHPVLTTSYSFPSGHSSNSLTALVLFALIAVPRQWRTTALAIAVPLALAIGLTRPFLGVHWPTDVLGGWCLAALAIWAAMQIKRRLSPEPA